MSLDTLRLIVSPCRADGAVGCWRFDLLDEETGEVLYAGTEHMTPRQAREAATAWRNRVYMTPVEMGT